MNNSERNIDKIVRDSFESTRGLPREDFWASIEEGLDKDDVVLNEVRKSYESMTTQGKDIWDRIDSSLSTERTWLRISNTLDGIILGSKTLVWTRVAAMLLICLLPFRFMDYSIYIPPSEPKDKGLFENIAVITVSKTDNIRLDESANNPIQWYQSLNTIDGNNSSSDVEIQKDEPVLSTTESENKESINELFSMDGHTALGLKSPQLLNENVLAPQLLKIEDCSDKLFVGRYHRVGLGTGTNAIIMEEYLPRYLDSHSPIPGYQVSLFYERLIGSHGFEGRVKYNKFLQKNGYFDSGEYKESKDVIVSSTLQVVYKRYFLNHRLALKFGGGANYNWLSYKVADDNIIDFLQFKPFHGSITTGVDVRPTRLPLTLSLDYSWLKDRDPMRNGIASIHAVQLGLNYFIEF